MHRNAEVLQQRAFGQAQFVGQIGQHALWQHSALGKSAASLAVYLTVFAHGGETAVALAAIEAIDQRVVDDAIAGLELLNLDAHLDNYACGLVPQHSRQLESLVVGGPFIPVIGLCFGYADGAILNLKQHIIRVADFWLGDV